jgi:colanic acid biosynthesis glycosyl transferase WcaI
VRAAQRILLLSLHFAPDTVSNAVVVTELAEELAARGHAVTAVAALPYHQGHRIEPAYRGRLWHSGRHGAIRVVRTWLLLRGHKHDVGGRFMAYGTFNLTSTLAAAVTGPYDVVITPSPPLTIGVCGWLLARLWGAKFVYNVQDIYPDAAIKLGLLRGPRVIRFFAWLERFVYARADTVTVLSEDFRRNLLAKRVPDAKVVLIPNGVDTEFVRPLAKDNAFAREHGLVDRFVVLYAGNVGLAQGIDTLIDAARQTTVPQILFLVVGAGAGLEGARARVEAAGLGNVRFLPFQPRERLPELYASADVGVVLLRAGMGSTSTPSKLYTIMAAGRAVVAAVDPESEASCLVSAAGCGECVPPENAVALAAALERLAADPRRVAAFGAAGRAHVVTHNSRSSVGAQYDGLIRQLQGAAMAARPA